MQAFYCRLAFFVVVAIYGFEFRAFGTAAFLEYGGSRGLVAHVCGFGGGLFLLLVAHAEEWRLQYVDVAFLNQFGEELQEERNHEQAYVHSVHIGVGGYDDFVVSKAVKAVFDVEGCLQEVELLVFVHHLLCKPERVERFAPEAEHGLRVHVAAFGYASRGRVALGYENAALIAPVAACVVEVYSAVAQLAVVEVGFLSPLACQFGDAAYGLAFLFGRLYLVEHCLGRVGRLVQVVVEVFLDVVANELVYAHAAGRHGEAAELYLRLALELRFLYVYGYGGHNAVAYVLVVEVLVEELLYRLGHVLLEGALVRSAERGVLSVYERVVFFAVLVGVCKGYLDVFARKVYYRVKCRGRHGVGEQVFEAVAALYFASVEDYCQPGVEVCVVAEQVFDYFRAEVVIQKERVVGLKGGVRAVFFVGGFGCVAHELSALEFCGAYHAVAVGTHFVARAQGVYGLCSHAVEAYAFLERLGIVFRAGV